MDAGAAVSGTGPALATSAAGAPVELDPLAGPGRRRLTLPTYPFQHQDYWIAPGARPLAANTVAGIVAGALAEARHILVRAAEADPRGANRAYAGFAWHLPIGLHLLVVIVAGLVGGASSNPLISNANGIPVLPTSTSGKRIDNMCFQRQSIRWRLIRRSPRRPVF